MVRATNARELQLQSAPAGDDMLVAHASQNDAERREPQRLRRKAAACGAGVTAAGNTLD